MFLSQLGIFLIPFYFLNFSIFTKEEFKSNLMFTYIAITLISFTLNSFIINPYRSNSILKEKSLNRSNPITNIVVDKSKMEKILLIDSLLKTNGFNKETDDLFIYPNKPGYFNFLNAKPYGNSWNFNGYKNVDLVNCFHINNEISNKRNVFFILEDSLPLGLRNCLFTKLHSYNKTKNLKIQNKESSVELWGPFKKK